MTRLALVLLLLGMAGAPARAEVVEVRSGMHDTFTRLVFAFDAPVTWRLGAADGGYRFLAGEDHSFDLTGVYDRIGRGRLRSLSNAEGGGVVFELGCDCHATAFDFGASWVVIDIRDGPPPPGSPFEEVIAASPDTGADGIAPDLAAPMPLDTDALAEASRSPAPRADAVDTLPRQARARENERVEAARTALMAQVGRAASQGLVAPETPANLERLEALARAATAPPDPASPGDADQTAAETHAAPRPADHLNLRALTAVDRDRRDPAAGIAPTISCLAPSALDVSSWGDGDDPVRQLSAARGALLGEFDLPLEGSPERLARLYIHLGFGAEARAVLSAFTAPGQGTDVLNALAEIVDDGAASAPNPLRDQLGCDGPGALWAVLSREDLSRGTPVNTREVSRHFSALPAALRHHLGPPLAARLLAAGQDETAHAIRAAIARSGGQAGDGVQLMNARIDLAGAEDASARAALDRAIAADGPATPEALIELTDHLVAEGQDVPGHLVQAAAALAFEHRHAPLGPALKRAELLGISRNEGYMAAFDGLAGAQDGRTPPAPGPELLPELLDGLLDEASDADLVGVFFRHRARLAGAELAAPQRRALARRLAEAGLPEAAAAFMRAGETSTAGEARILEAEILLAANEPLAALAAMETLSGARANALRIRALELQQDYARALEAAQSADRSGPYTELAWRAGDWRGVLDGGETLQQEAVGLALGLPAVAEMSDEQPEAQTPAAAAPAGARPSAQPGLASGRRLLDDSEAARNTVGALLEEYALTPRGGG